MNKSDSFSDACRSVLKILTANGFVTRRQQFSAQRGTCCIVANKGMRFVRVVASASDNMVKVQRRCWLVYRTFATMNLATDVSTFEEQLSNILVILK